MIQNYVVRGLFCSLVILSLSACGRPKCDSDEVIDQVVEILDEDGGLKRYLRHNPDESIAGPTLFEKTPDHARLERQIGDLKLLLEDTEKQEGCSNISADIDLSDQQLKKCADIKNNILSDLELKIEQKSQSERDFNKSREDKFDKLSSNIKYNIEKIVDRTKNKDRDMITCRATITADIDGWGGAYEDVIYHVERTTDGNSYVFVRGY